MFAPAPAVAQDYTLEQVMSSPMPSDLVAAPRGEGAVAWIQNREGVRNVWVATAPDYRGRRVTDYSEDDGRPLAIEAFPGAGEDVIYSRGGSPNRSGDYPNPTSARDGGESGLWIVPADGSSPPRELDAGGGLAFSPVDDGRAAFTRGGAIWTLRIGPDTVETERIASVRGGLGSPMWSPDGSRLAFTSRRGGHGFVGVLEVDGDSPVRWMDPGIDGDREPAWSPDGSRIAFIRVPDMPDQEPFTPRRTTDRPWSIVVADAATGEGRVVWTAREGYGSVFRGADTERQLLWTDDDRLVFPWERSGWLNLYSIRADASRDQSATPLTPGDFEVKHVALAPDRRAIVYSSNQDDIDRKHLWRVPADGSRPPERLTPGDGLEWSPTPTADGRAIAFLASDATAPAHAEILALDDDAGARRPLAPGGVPVDFPSGELVTPEQVVFPAADGLPIHGQLFRPRGLDDDDERAPAIVFFHGGSRRQMLLGFHHR
ncbi:MAG: DPP IV N-terminal domain-containing protein, partial [Gemmatimonadota bacterium]